MLRLYRRIGVELEESNFDYSFFTIHPLSPAQTPSYDEKAAANGKSNAACSEPDASVQHRFETSFIYNGSNGLSLRPFSFPSSSASVHHIAYLIRVFFFIACYLYLLLLSFYHYAFSHTSASSPHWLSTSTFSTFLRRTRIPDAFSREILIPLFSCVTTCSPEELLEYPVAELLEYVVLTFGRTHYVVRGGVRNCINRLLERIPEERIHLSCDLVQIRPDLTRLDRKGLELVDADGTTRRFDQVIFATQANQAGTLLRTYCKALQDMPESSEAEVSEEKRRIAALQKFQYTRSVVINHYEEEEAGSHVQSDRRMLNLGRWADPRAPTKAEDAKERFCMPRNYVSATHDLTPLHPHIRHGDGSRLYQTTNPTRPIPKERILSEQEFERAKVTLESRASLVQFTDVGRTGWQGRGGLWFVGAWASEVSTCFVSSRLIEW